MGAQLPRRQSEVLARVLRGASNKEIASDLQLTEQCVKAHVSRLLRRFDVTNRTALAIAALSVPEPLADESSAALQLESASIERDRVLAPASLTSGSIGIRGEERSDGS